MCNRSFTDQMGNVLHIPLPPKRIISLVPSQTELLFDLGLKQEVVGITKFCIHPKEKVKTVMKIGGTKNFHFDRIAALKPDLILGNKEENYKEGIEQLQKEYLVWISDISNLSEALSMIQSVGEIVGKTKRAQLLNDKIAKYFRELHYNNKMKSAIYLIWQKPNMVVGKGTFISEMMQRAGFENLIQEDRYPKINHDEIAQLNPEYILLSSEPFPFKEKQQLEFQSNFPNSKVLLVDGELFSWYGSRLILTAEYFKNLIK